MVAAVRQGQPAPEVTSACGGSTPTWFAGVATSTSGSGRGRREHGTGLRRSSAPTQLSLLTGACCMAAGEHREPYEPRGSRTDLGARGGEIPLRDSPYSG